MKKEQKSLKFFHKETKSISTTTLEANDQTPCILFACTFFLHTTFTECWVKVRDNYKKPLIVCSKFHFPSILS